MKHASFFSKAVLFVSMMVGMGTLDSTAAEKVETYDVQRFSGISASSAIDILYTQGNTNSVVVQGEDKDVATISISVKGNTLYVRRTPGVHRVIGPIKITVTSQTLNNVQLSGASSIKMGNVACDDFQANISGASRLKGTLKAKTLSMHVSGASNLELVVDCQESDVHLSGASQVNLSGSCHRIEGSCSGASRLNLNGCAEVVDVRGSGASTINR